MYLARIFSSHGPTLFSLRESVWDPRNKCYRCHHLCDLGPDPGRHLVYAGHHAFYLDPELVDRVQGRAEFFDEEELEALFLPFLDPEIRQVLDDFHCLDRTGRARTKMSRAEIEAVREGLHPFDKRRLAFLRLGSTEPATIHRIPPVFFRVLLQKCRDELEQYFLVLEEKLLPNERKLYAYQIFDLPRFFAHPLARSVPQAVDQEKADTLLVEELCQLDRDRRFWAGVERDDRLSAYLVRYLIIYFDSSYPQGMAENEFTRRFMGRRRRHRPMRSRATVSDKEAARVLGIRPEEIADLNRRRLTRLFRSQAHRLHPDKGGSKEKFIRLIEAYRSLRRKLARRSGR